MLDLRWPIALVLLATAAAIAPASAQSPRPFSLRVPAQDGSAGSDGSIQVSVNYGLNLPLKSDDAKAQGETLEGARRALYEIAASECKVLLATIASSCKLERLNVHSNVQRRRGEDSVNVNGNAAYRVVLK